MKKLLNNKETAYRLSQLIGYTFKDISLPIIALTHRSKSASNNERLEFLGDAVLSLIAAQFLFSKKQYLKEGDLSALRASFVCQKYLSECASNHNLQKIIISDTASPSILCDAVEAIIGAVFLDGGLDAAQAVTFKLLGEPKLELPLVLKDPKTELQELVQAKKLPSPEYELIDIEGPAHAPAFIMGVKIEGKLIAISKGESKKIAAQKAALEAMVLFGKDYS